VSWWRDGRARTGAILLLAIAVVGAGAPFLAPYDPRVQDRDSFHRPPALPTDDCHVTWWTADASGARRLFVAEGCRIHLLGTDRLGRDVLSRLLYGARWSALAAALGVVAAVAFGTLIGATSGFFGGWSDRLLMRLTELVMALPALYLVLAVRNLFPDRLTLVQSTIILVGSLAAVGWCGVSRMIRGQILSLRERDFVSSAVAAGATRSRLLFRHILPNAIPFILLQAGLVLPYFLLGEATLSFLGLGVQEPHPSWGNMLAAAAGNYTFMTTYWWTLVAPAAGLTLAVGAANLWMDGLRRTYWLDLPIETGSLWARWGSKQRRQRAS
jgi:peptide/nickel transport system permease protein